MSTREQREKYVEGVLKVAKFLPVFPVVHGKKIPMFKGWQDKATKDEAQIREWWDIDSDRPLPYVGVPTGSRSGVWVVDIDEKDGKTGRDALKNHPEMPPTFSQTTKSGGTHLIYEYDELFDFRGSTDTLGPLVDTRAEGNLIVVWPTPGYKFNGKIKDVAETPEWLAKFMEDRKTKKKPTAKVDRVFGASEVNKMLRDVDVTEYRDRDSWRNMIMSVKAASGGEEYGFQALLDWSLQDAEYFGDDIEDNLRTIWDTVEVEREGGITAGTLVKAARKGEIKKKVEAGFHELSVSYEWDFNQNGDLRSNETNLLLMLTKDKVLLNGDIDETENPYFGLFVYNELKEAVVFARNPPWALKDRDYVDQVVEPHDISELRLSITNHMGVNFAMGKAKEIVVTAARRSPNNPVLNYLDSLEWDGEERLETWLIKYAGATDNEYVRAISKKTLISGAARAYDPGCQAQNILVLESDQGVGKSTIVSILGGRWAGAPEFPIGDKDAEQNLQGLWIVEWSEMATTYKKEAAQIKSFLTKAVNRFRGSYGETTRDWPRRCIIIGTHNPGASGEWLVDDTGNRRYWPVRITGVVDNHPKLVDFDGLSSVRDQLWAEAAHCYKQGQTHDLTAREKQLALAEQDERLVKDPRAEVIYDALYHGAEWADKEEVTVLEVALNLFDYRERDLNKAIKNEIASNIRSIGWEPTRKWKEGRTQLVFVRPEAKDE